MTELELCPFCGGEAEVLTAESMNGGYLFGIMCNDCRSRGDVYDTEAEAIAAWNTRTERVGERKTINKTGDFATHDTRAERTCKADYRSGGYGIGGWYCSECGGYMHDDMQQDMAYCPNCGAKVVDE